MAGCKVKKKSREETEEGSGNLDSNRALKHHKLLRTGLVFISCAIMVGAISNKIYWLCTFIAIVHF